MFTSRMDAEKNPWFMLEVARAFLHRHKDWEWLCTTSAAAGAKNNTAPNTQRGRFDVVADARLDAASTSIWVSSSGMLSHMASMP